MTSDLKAQLALLERRWTPRPRLAPVHYDAEQILSGQVVENDRGRFFLHEKFFPAHRRHGSVEFSQLSELPAEALPGLSGGEIPPIPSHRWAFLDTETTGLAGGAGTCAFLVGVGTVEEAGFRVRLFFMRDYDEEPAMLEGLAELLAGFDVLVTYNGKTFDAPLLETRYRLARRPCPLERLPHLDLLFAARRLWRLRLETCRLIELENQILGVEREGDLPGELIPYYYFEYLRTRQAFRLVPLFHHNVTDILSLAALTAVALPAFAAPAEAKLRHGQDTLGLARWLRQNADGVEEALALYRRALDQGLPDQHLFAALWEISLMEKKKRQHHRAVEVWTELAGVKNAFHDRALEELAKYYEHVEHNFPRAMEMTDAALASQKLPELEHRRRRLQRKLGSPQLLP